MTINRAVNSTYAGVIPELVILSPLHCVACMPLCAPLSYCGTFASFFCLRMLKVKELYPPAGFWFPTVSLYSA